MNRTMITATNTLSQMQKQIDTISQNIANVDTTGYKKRDATFSDLLFQQVNNQRHQSKEVNRFTPNGIRQGTGAKLSQTQLVFSQAAIKNTDRSLDTAFTKQGQMYRVLVQQGENSQIQYTRDGAFSLSPISENEALLVTSKGYPILDENNQPITINARSAKEYTISSNGRLTVVLDNNTEQNFNLGVTYVKRPQFLEQKGENLYSLPENMPEINVTTADIFTELNGPLRNEISIEQKSLEQSNVDLSKEMTDLISTERAYQFQTRSVTLADQMMGLVNGIR